MKWVKCFSSRAAGEGIIFGLLTLASTAFGQQWNTLTPLPDGYNGQSLAYSSNFLYQAGGSSLSDGIGDSINVFYSQVQTNGTIGAWNATSPLPEGAFFHAGVAANGFLYVLGGVHYVNYFGELVTNSVYYAKINPDGSVGSWQTANPLPQVAMFLSASAWNNTIYVVGGSDGSVSSSNVYSAKIQADGSLSSWVAQPSLPFIIQTQASAANGFLYVLGGVTNDTQVESTVYYSKINADGSLAGWNQTTPMPQPNSNFAAVAAGGRLYVMGGDTGSSLAAVFYSAPVMGDGTLGAWSSGTSLPDQLYEHAVTVNDSNIFLAGGIDNSGNPQPGVYSMALPAAPVAPSLTSSNFVNGSFQLRLSSSSTNTGFGLLASTNLTSWTNLGWGFTDTNGLLQFQDTNAASFPSRFYRAYWPLP